MERRLGRTYLKRATLGYYRFPRFCWESWASAIKFSGAHLDPQLAALIFGISIIAGAFLLSWAAEVAQLDVSASFAIAILALIAVMPEYMVEATLAWNAGTILQPRYASRDGEDVPRRRECHGRQSPADRTGLVRRHHHLLAEAAAGGFDMRGLLTLELPMLVVATLLTIAVAFFKMIPIWLAAVFIGAYIFYLWRSSTQESEEPDLLGAAAMIASFKPLYRRLWVLGLFIFSAAVIIIVAPPFVHGLEATGEALGISKFLLIQWLAPLASESPEIIVAVLFALRANPNDGLTTLISSQVNQLTLLVGSIVVVFSISAGQPLSFHLDHYEPVNLLDRLASGFGLQSSEFLLTAAAAAFGILLISTRVIKLWHGLALLGVFMAYMMTLLWFPGIFGGVDDVENVQENVPLRMWSSVIVFGLAALLVALNWRRVIYVFKGVPRPEELAD